MIERGTLRTLLAVLGAPVLPALLSAAQGEDGEAPGAPAKALRRQEYEGFYPFFSRERFEDGGVKTTAAFHLVQVESGTNGEGHHHVLPLYYFARRNGGADRSLGIFPAYLWRRAPGAGHDIVLPTFARWRSGDSSHLVLWPLLQTAREPEPGPFNYLPTLFRHGSWKEENRERLGLPPFFQLFERSSKPAETAYTLGNFFNFDEETSSGLPLGKLSLKRHGDWRGHLFPLVFAKREGLEGYTVTPLLSHWSGADRSGWAAPLLLSWWAERPDGSDLDLLWPLVRFEVSPDASTRWVAPFYFSGESRDAGGSPVKSYRFFSLLYGRLDEPQNRKTDHYVPPLLGHYRSTDDELQLDLLAPLGHYRRSGDRELSVRALPFFDRERDANGSSLGVGLLLYRRHQDFFAESLGQWAPMPLVHWKTSPEGLVAWAVPAFYHADSKTGAERTVTTVAVPGLILRRKTEELAEGGSLDTLRSAQLWPAFGWRRKRDAGGLDDRAWYALFPFFRFSVCESKGKPAERKLHAPWPFVRYRSTGDPTGERAGAPAETEFRLDPFLFAWERTVDTLTVTGPLAWFRYRSSPERGWFHLFPIGFGQREGDRSGLGIFPFYYGREYGKEDVNYWTLGRFFFLWNSLGNERERHRSFLWKALEHSSAGGDYDFRILHRLVVNRSVKGQREVAVGPLFRSFRDRESGVRSFSLLSILYRSELRGGTETKRVLLIPVSVRKAGA